MFHVMRCGACGRDAVVMATEDQEGVVTYRGVVNDLLSCVVCAYENEWPTYADPRPDPAAPSEGS
jgi:hypothetical protein